MSIPYSYHLFHMPTQKHYYGIRFCKRCEPSELWVTYFSSSIIVKQLIAEYGVGSFLAEVRRIFSNGVEATLWEHRVLTRIHAAERDDWLNRHNGGKKFRGPTHHSNKTKEKLRLKITGMKRKTSTKEKLAASAKIREDNKRKEGWKMPREAIESAIKTRKARIASGEITPYSIQRNEKVSRSKTGTKRKYLPDGSFIMIRP